MQISNSKFSRLLRTTWAAAAALVVCVAGAPGFAQDTPAGEPREAEVQRLFAEAAFGGAETAEKAAAAKRRLVELCRDALPYVVTKLDSKNTREIAVVEAVVEATGEAAVAPLLAQLDGANEGATVQALRLLGNLGPPAAAAVERLCGVATGGRTWQIRAGAANALGRIGEPKASDALLTALFDQSEPVRRDAAIALGKLKPAAAVQPLIRALDDRFFSVRYAAADALVAIGGDAAAELSKKLEPFATSSGDAKLEFSDTAAAHAVQVLGRLKDAKTANLLRRLLGSIDWGIRAAAAEALGAVGGGPATRLALEKALATEKNYLVRRNIEDTLARTAK